LTPQASSKNWTDFKTGQIVHIEPSTRHLHAL